MSDPERAAAIPEEQSDPEVLSFGSVAIGARKLEDPEELLSLLEELTEPIARDRKERLGVEDDTRSDLLGFAAARVVDQLGQAYFWTTPAIVRPSEAGIETDDAADLPLKPTLRAELDASRTVLEAYLPLLAEQEGFHDPYDDPVEQPESS